MSQGSFKRKLTTIFSADVAGYSRLMGNDESATVRTIETYRKVMSELIMQHRGRVIDSPGDNLLAEFGSVVDAVQCAVAVQKELQARNTELTKDRKMEFRIGINLGDVIQEGDRIYGDGVNIAARLEGLADPGGICISKTSFDHIESKLPYGYDFIGDQTVKNIAKPVGAYRVSMEPRVTVTGETEEEKQAPVRRMPIIVGVVVVIVLAVAAGIWQFYINRPSIEPATVEKMAYPLPDKPSIAVLPFVNMSDDPKQEYFSDAIVENIITALSKVSDMFVIARNSTFIYKGKAVKIKQVAEGLGVRYVLEGSVQKTEDRVRITAQLIDAITGTHLWAERYDSDLKDIFDLQDKITKKIITSLHIKLTYGEDARLISRYTDSLEAYLKLLEGHTHQMRLNKDDNILARQLYKEAIALDPNYVTAYVELAWTHLFDANYGWGESRDNSLETAYNLAQKALTIDDSFAGIYATLGSIHLQKGEIKEAFALRQKAVALEPNSANYHALLGTTYLFMKDRTDEAIAELKNANRLDPFPPNWILHYLGEAYRVNDKYEKAIEIYKKSIKKDSNYWLSHLSLSACYGLLGLEKEARVAAEEVLRIDPNFSITKVIIPYRDMADKTRTVEVLRKAGLR
jgi:adenylate cyclase